MIAEWYRGPQFASPEAAAEWTPIIARAAKAWDALEVESVASGIRTSALVFLSPEELVRATADAGEHGFDVVPVAFDGAKIRAAVCRAGLRESWLSAWRTVDHAAIGSLLGFPPCCLDYFRTNWEAGKVDTVLTLREKDGPPEGNVYHRHLGVRLVPFLPCSADCAPALRIGRAFAEVGRAAGLDVEAIYQVLDLPVRYSSRGGIAITETPHFRYFSGSDSGSGSTSRAGEPASYEDNGFKTRAGMEAAHAIVAAVVNAAEVTSALDLGAGDGALLERLRAGRKGDSVNWRGIESDSGRAARGTRRHPEIQVLNFRIEDWTRSVAPTRYGAVLLMPGRLLEMEPSRAEDVRRWLAASASRVVLYTYGDWGDLAALAIGAGFAIEGPVIGTPGGVQVAVGRI